MDIITAANQWARAELVSAIFFILFGLAWLFVSFACWQWGSTALTKALIIPMLLAGLLLAGAGIGFYVSNNAKLKSFESDYKNNPSELITSEIERTEQTIKTYQNVALKVFPAIIVIALLVCLFVSYPLVRAICIGIIAFLAVLVLLDSQALKRMKVYNQHLQIEKNK